MIKIYVIILILIILYGIFKSNISKEKFDNNLYTKESQNDNKDKYNEFYVPEGNSNTPQTIDMTRKLMETLSQSHADSKYDHKVGSIDNVNPPTGTKRNM